MRTFPPNPCRRIRSAIGSFGSVRATAGSQDGFLLIEVLISALLLGLVAAATVTGLQAVDDNTTNQRMHNEAVLLASQSQEQLRSSPVSALERLLNSPHVYTTTITGNGTITKYTITQEVHEFNTKEENTTCSVVEHGSYTAPNFRVSSTVSWSFLKGGHPVSETSIITPPTSSSLEVDVGNAPSPTGGVAEVPVAVSYAAFETGTPIKLEGATNAQGCIFFTGIRATSATVEIGKKSGFVMPSGILKVPSSEVSIAPGLTTRDAVTYDRGGAIAANFAYNGKTEFAGKKVTGDTFVVANTEIGAAPELEIGSASGFSYELGGEEHYTAKTSGYGASGSTAKGASYERGDLFPFPSTSWTVFAGDCAANNPNVITKGAVTAGEGIVTPGSTTGVAVPESYVNLEALQGTEKSPSKTLNAETLAAKITNLSCSAANPAPATPNNAAAVSYTHTQHVTAGALENPFQPFGEFEICVQAVESLPEPAKDRIDKFVYANTGSEGAHFALYPQELTLANEKKAREEQEETSPARVKRVAEEKEQATERNEEATSKAAREAKEATLKEAAEAEASAKATREAQEAANIAKWEAEEKEKVKGKQKLTKAEREIKEKEQITKREEAVTKEKAAAAKRKGEAETLTKQAETEATAKKARQEREAKTAATKSKEEEAATKASKEEEEKAKAKEKLFGENKAQKVESGTGVKC
jgi:Tfp pilus assembly protein PilV